MSLIDRLEPEAALASVATGGRRRKDRAARREALFRETPHETFKRVVLGTAYALQPSRVGKLVPLARLWIADRLSPQEGLPDPDIAPGRDEFAGIVRDLSPRTLIAAYERGLFPMGHYGPLKWMSPKERCVLSFEDFHMSRRLRATMRQGKYQVTFDEDFEAVMKACAGPRSGHWHLTWITPRIMRAYAELHDLGVAHSFEVWNEKGELVGGGYGVALGGAFFIESQFSHATNTSKLGFSVLNFHLARWGFALADNKWPTAAILQMGFRDIPRRDYLRKLAEALSRPGRSGRWQMEAGPREIADWVPGGGTGTEQRG